ncbi:hypothetical protein L7F22_056105 [Adiantum nelumboides]|nr:hypothetical protein [Adiantum nelumboides]
MHGDLNFAGYAAAPMGSLNHFSKLNPIHGGSFADATRGLQGSFNNPLYKVPGHIDPGKFLSSASNFYAPWEMKDPTVAEPQSHSQMKKPSPFGEVLPKPGQEIPINGANPNEATDSLNPASPNKQATEGIILREEDLSAWHNQLNERVVLGICHGQHPSMDVLKQWIAVNRENKNVFPQHIQYLPSNYYLFFFEDAYSALQVIIEGQWLIKNTPISFFKWHKGFNPREEKPTKIPVWVDFSDLPVKFYPWLGKLGNSIGKVLKSTARQSIDHAQYVLNSLKGTKKEGKVTYLGAPKVLTKIAYHAIGMADNLPPAPDENTLDLAHRVSPRATRSTRRKTTVIEESKEDEEQSIETRPEPVDSEERLDNAEKRARRCEMMRTTVVAHQEEPVQKKARHDKEKESYERSCQSIGATSTLWKP